jgi:hypothetical protein
MSIDQRKVGTLAITATAQGNYILDRWRGYSNTGPGVNGSRSTAAPMPFGFAAAVQLAPASVALTATQYVGVMQWIEADVLTDLAWGTSAATSVTLSFWAQMTAGAGRTCGGALQNLALNRSCTFNFVLPDNQWHYFAITFPGDTGGVWPATGAGAALRVFFALAAGATVSTPVGVWTAGNFISGPGSTANLVNGNNFRITGVQLETGSTPTPYIYQHMAKRISDCSRYYQALPGLVIYAGAAGGVTLYDTLMFQPMRAAPVVALTDQTFTVGGGNTLAVVQVTSPYGPVVGTVVVSFEPGAGGARATYTARIDADYNLTGGDNPLVSADEPAQHPARGTP